MGELKRKGHDIEIIALIIHQVAKEQHSTLCNVKLASSLIIPQDKEKLFETVVKLQTTASFFI